MTYTTQPKSHGKLALTLSYISIAAALIALALGGVAILLNTEKFSLEIVLIVIPALLVVAAVVGVVAIVLSLITRARFGHSDKHWLKALVVGLIGAILLPLIGWAMANLA